MTVFDGLAVAALIVSIVALPPVFQMYGGRPSITIRSETNRSELGCALYSSILNLPVGNWILQLLGVRRESVAITVDMAIVPLGGEQPERPVAVVGGAWLVGDNRRAINLELSPGPVPVEVMLVSATRAGAQTFDQQGRSVPLAPGSYRAETLVRAGEKIYVRRHDFVVTANLVGSYWADLRE